LDGQREPLGERGRHGLTASQELFEKGEGFGEFLGGCGSNFDPDLDLAFEGLDGEPGNRFDSSVYLLVADVEVGTQTHGVLAPGCGEHALPGEGSQEPASVFDVDEHDVGLR
jgi:hypothetical protein